MAKSHAGVSAFLDSPVDKCALGCVLSRPEMPRLPRLPRFGFRLIGFEPSFPPTPSQRSWFKARLASQGEYPYSFVHMQKMPGHPCIHATTVIAYTA